jgi:cytochrome P450
MLVVVTISAAVPALILLRSYYFQQQPKKKNKNGGNIMAVPFMGRTAQGSSWPFLGQALTFLRHSPWDLITTWHRDYQSPIICFQLLGTLTYSVASPRLCQAILQSRIGHTKKDVENAMKPFLSILGTGIVTSEGEAWLRQRRHMSHPLRHDVLQYIPAQTMRALDRLCIVLDAAAASKTPVPMGALLRHLTLQVISGTFLSLSATESDEQFATLYLPIVEESNVRVWHPYRRFCFFLPSFWQYHSNVYRLNRYVSSLIRRRWEQGPKDLKDDDNNNGDDKTSTHDVLDTMLAAYRRDHPPNNGTTTMMTASTLPPAAVRQFRDEIKTFMLAGHETSAAMMTWTLYELVHHPSLVQQVVDEGSAVWNINDNHDKTTRVLSSSTEQPLPTPEELSKLELAECCLKESLRKYSVVPMVARLITKDLIVDDQYFLPKGSAVMIDIVGVHLDPTLWPEPLRYDPYRFYRPDAPPLPYTFIPFIAGPRNCLGQNLALLESKMVISYLLQKYRFQLRQPVADTADWSGDHNPRHRFMIPLIPKQEVMLEVETMF